MPHEDISPEDHPKESREWVLTECPLSVGPWSATSWMSPSSLYEEEPRLPIPRLEGLKSTPFPPAVGTHTSSPSGFLAPRSAPSPALSQPLGLEGPHSGLQALLSSQRLQRELSAPAHAGVGVCKRSERPSFNDSSIPILEQVTCVYPFPRDALTCLHQTKGYGIEDAEIKESGLEINSLHILKNETHRKFPGSPVDRSWCFH